MRIEISTSAQRHLEEIHAAASEFSPIKAAKIVAKFHKRLKQLAAFPLSGSQIPERGYPQLRQVLVGPYRVLYHVQPDCIEIIGFLHSARQWPES